MSDQFDKKIRAALTPSEEPDFWLNQRIMNSKMEEPRMKRKMFKTVPALVLSVVCVLGVCGIGTFAAWKYLSPEHVASQLGESKIAEAFAKGDATVINETQSSDGYDVTLLGVISGKDLTQYAGDFDGEIHSDRTYVVTAIANADGTAMPDTSTDEYGQNPFFASCYIAGYNPAKYNAATFDGGYKEYVENGVTYRMLECDNIELFADHTIYFGVNSGVFYDENAFCYDEKTGKMKVNEKYMQCSVLFTLPMDKAKADDVAAEEYIKKLESADSTDNDDEPEELKAYEEKVRKLEEDIKRDGIDTYCKVVQNTVQTVKPDENNCIYVKWDARDCSGEGMQSVEAVLEDGVIGKPVILGFTGDGNEMLIETGTLNEDGTITFAVYEMK